MTACKHVTNYYINLLGSRIQSRKPFSPIDPRFSVPSDGTRKCQRASDQVGTLLPSRKEDSFKHDAIDAGKMERNHLDSLDFPHGHGGDRTRAEARKQSE